MCYKVDLEYPKELRELENDSPLAPDKIEIKEKRLPSYQLKNSDLYNIPTGNAKKKKGQKQKKKQKTKDNKKGKALYKLMNNAMYGKTMKTLKNKIDVKLVGKKQTSKPSYISHKVFDNNLVQMHKSKVTLTLNMPAQYCIVSIKYSIDV